MVDGWLSAAGGSGGTYGRYGGKKCPSFPARPQSCNTAAPKIFYFLIFSRVYDEVSTVILFRLSFC